MRVVPGAIAANLPAAAELFAARGVEHTKMEDVAAATGVPKATLYYYFSGKEEILAFLFQDLLTRLADEIGMAVSSEASARDRLREVVRAHLRVMAEQPSACRALTGELGRAGRMPAIAAAIHDAYHAPVMQVLRDGQTDGSIRRLEDLEAAALTVFGAVTVIGLARLVADTALDVEAATHAVDDALLRGFAPASPRTSGDAAGRPSRDDT